MKPYLFLLLTFLLFILCSQTSAKPLTDVAATGNDNDDTDKPVNEEKGKEPASTVSTDTETQLESTAQAPPSDPKSLEPKDDKIELESKTNLQPFFLAFVLFAAFALISVVFVLKHRNDNRIHNCDLI